MKKYNNIIRFENLDNLYITWPTDLEKEEKKITFLYYMEDKFLILDIDYQLKNIILFGKDRRKDSQEEHKAEKERRRDFKILHHETSNEKKEN